MTVFAWVWVGWLVLSIVTFFFLLIITMFREIKVTGEVVLFFFLVNGALLAVTYPTLVGPLC